MLKIPLVCQLAGTGVARLTKYFAQINKIGEIQNTKRLYTLTNTALVGGAMAYSLSKCSRQCHCLKSSDIYKDKDQSLMDMFIEKVCHTQSKITDPGEIKKMLKITGDSYRNAISSTKLYTEKITSVMEKCIKNDGSVASKLWIDLKNASEQMIDAENRLNESLKYFDPCVASEEVRNEIIDLRKHYEVAKAGATVASKYWNQVMETRKHYRNELEVVFPHVDITAENLNLRGGKKEDLLNMILDEVLVYQMHLSELQCELTTIVDRALTATKEDIVNAKMDLCLAEEKRKWEKKFLKKMMISKEAADREINDKLQEQALIHKMKIKDKVDAHIEKAIREERKKNDERTTAEKTAESLKLASMLGRLQAVDTELKNRMEFDKTIKQAQLLWAACEALEGVLNGRTDTRMKVSIDKELDAIAIAAGPKDKIVKTIIDAISEIKKEGVISEKALYRRYFQVEKVCRSLAQVPEQGANLFGIILSQVQGYFTKNPSPMPCEFTEPPKNTYEILERVRFYVDKRDWYQALRYMKMLEGIPNRVSNEWTCQLIQHIEAKQASAALLTHAYSKLRSS